MLTQTERQLLALLSGMALIFSLAAGGLCQQHEPKLQSNTVDDQL